MKISQLVLGPVSTNVWILVHEDTNQGILVDPAAEPDRIQACLRKLDVQPAGILLTHGHFDHIMAVPRLKEQYPGLVVYANQGEAALLKDPESNLSGAWMGRPTKIIPEILLKDGQEFTLAGFHIRVLATPGHTQGSCCYYFPEEQILISGDTLFAGSYGRVDLPTGSGSAMLHSLKEKVLTLPAETKVYPGHGDTTVIGWEKDIVW